MTKKHFEVQYDGWRYFHVADTINERCIARLDTKGDADAYLEIVEDYEELVQENEQLKECNAENSFMIDCFADEEVRLITENEKLKKENKELKKENYKLHKRLGDFEPFEKYIKERTSKILSVNDIIKTDEPTNSVELKKELYK